MSLNDKHNGIRPSFVRSLDDVDLDDLDDLDDLEDEGAYDEVDDKMDELIDIIDSSRETKSSTTKLSPSESLSPSDLDLYVCECQMFKRPVTECPTCLKKAEKKEAASPRRRADRYSRAAAMRQIATEEDFKPEVIYKKSKNKESKEKHKPETLFDVKKPKRKKKNDDTIF